jgi:hypothetical protein
METDTAKDKTTYHVRLPADQAGLIDTYAEAVGVSGVAAIRVLIARGLDAPDVRRITGQD